MKAKRGEIERAVGNPGAYRLFLFHGADIAGSNALAAKLSAALGPDVERVSLTPAALKSDPALLADEESLADSLAEAALADGRATQLYPSSKSAVAQWARRTSVSPGWADAGIALNVVAPGVVLTPMSAGLIADPAMKKVMDAAVPMPLHGYASPEDLARAVGVFLSPELTHVTGQVLYVDGGATLV